MKGSDTDYTLLQSTMTPDRNHTASVTDTNGSQTSYTYNASTEQLTGTSTYNPETGKTISTNRVYNASNGRQTQMYIDGALSMSYAYKKRRAFVSYTQELPQRHRANGRAMV